MTKQIVEHLKSRLDNHRNDNMYDIREISILIKDLKRIRIADITQY